MADTFELLIDGKTAQGTAETTILQAAARIGVKIPTLCYDPRLQPFGACRLCLVEVEQMKGRLIPACSTPVTKGMIVHTQTEAVKKARRMVLELLMIHHPLDCPVCDKAGECRLQDALFEYGADQNRLMYGQVKADNPIEARSPLIERDTTRCILCGLCVRVCDEVQSTGEISFVGRGFPARVGTCFDKPLACEFCGQCISICPVGALNSKGFKHRVRVWDLSTTTTVCGFCGVGCTIDAQTRGDRVYRVKAEYGKGINEGNLCGKGRFGWDYVHEGERLKEPLVRKEGRLVPATWDEAIQAAVRGFRGAIERHGTQAAAGLASPRIANEDAFLFAKLMKEVFGVPSVDTAASHYIGPILAQARVQLGQASSCATLADIHEARAFVVVNSSAQESNPVAGNRVIHQKRFAENVSLITIHPRRMKMARYADHWLAVPPEAAADVLLAMCRAILDANLAAESAAGLPGFASFREALAAYTPEAVGGKWAISAERIAAAALAFAKAGPGMVVLGAVPFADATNRAAAAAAIDLLLLTGNVGRAGAGLLVMVEKNNMQGVLDAGLAPGAGGRSAREIVRALDDGSLRALYLLGENLTAGFPGGANRARALAGLDFLVVHELFLTETAKQAHVVFPAAAFLERGGTFTNLERRVQPLRRVVPPPGTARPDGDILIDVARAAGAKWTYHSALDALVDLVQDAHAGVEIRLANFRGSLCQKDLSGGLPEGATGFAIPEKLPAPAPLDGYPLRLEVGPVLYHSGTLSLRSPQLRDVYPRPIVEMNREDAKALGVREGEEVDIASAAGAIAARARVSRNVPKGSVFVPFHFAEAPGLALAGADGEGRVKVSRR